MSTRVGIGRWNAFLAEISSIALSATYVSEGVWDDSGSAPADYVTTLTENVNFSASKSASRVTSPFVDLEPQPAIATDPDADEFRITTGSELDGYPDPLPPHFRIRNISATPDGFQVELGWIVNSTVRNRETYVAVPGYMGAVPSNTDVTVNGKVKILLRADLAFDLGDEVHKVTWSYVATFLDGVEGTVFLEEDFTGAVEVDPFTLEGIGAGFSASDITAVALDIGGDFEVISESGSHTVDVTVT